MPENLQLNEFEFWNVKRASKASKAKKFHVCDFFLDLRLIAVILTKKCPLKCKHCFVKKEEVDFSLEGLISLIDEISKKGSYNGIVFTGGEPFAIFKELKEGIEYAKQKKMFTVITTSGYWAGTKAKAEEYIRGLKGLDILAVSVDKYHQEQVPLKNIENILAIAQEIGIKTLLTILLSNNGELDGYRQLANKFSCDYYVQNLCLKRTQHENELVPMAKFNWGIDLKSKFCSMMSPYIDVDGEVFYCGGPIGINERDHFLHLGNIYEGVVDSDFNKEKWQKINKFLGQDKTTFFRNLKKAGVKLPGKYYSKCDICYDLITLNKDNKYIIDQVN